MTDAKERKPATKERDEESSNETRWTIMVFMGAGRAPSTAPLTAAAQDDLQEMAAVFPVAPGTRSPVVDVFVQVHGLHDVPHRGQVKPGVLELEPVPAGPDGEREDGHDLEAFVSWALGAARYQPGSPAHRTMLILWGHTFDFAFGPRQLRDGTVDAIDFAEISDVFERTRAKTGADHAKLDVIAFDSCDVSTIEIACQLAPYADFLIGSQVGVPLPGWPYDRILQRLRDPHGRQLEPAEFGAYIVRRFCESYRAVRPVSLTVLDLRSAPTLLEYSGRLAALLADALDDEDIRDRVWKLFLRSQTDTDRPYVDVADLCLSLQRELPGGPVAEAARALGDFLVEPQPLLAGLSRDGVGLPFVVEHGRNAGRMARLNGVSIYAPHVSEFHDFKAVRAKYENFRFERDTRWSEVVYTLARMN